VAERKLEEAKRELEAAKRKLEAAERKLKEAESGQTAEGEPEKPKRRLRGLERLTDVKIRNHKPDSLPCKLWDGGGLYLYFSEAGGRVWRFSYRHEGRPQTLTLEKYPDMSLQEARAAHREARKLLAKGGNPAAEKRERKKAAAQGPTFGDISGEFVKLQEDTMVSGTARNNARRLENHLLPVFGARPAAAVRRLELRAHLDGVAEKASRGLAGKLATLVSQVYRAAADGGHEDLPDPAGGLAGRYRVKEEDRRHLPAVTSPDGLGTLLADIEGYSGRGFGKAALRLLPFVFVRARELCGAEWGEIDLEGASWTIPAKRMKGRRREHVVPLAPQAVDMLKALKERTGNGSFVFQSLRSRGRPISPDTPGEALRSLGWLGSTTAHGFRTAASTLLNEAGFPPDWIEAQLAHREGNAVRDAYNRAKYLEGRTRMMLAWGDFLAGLKAEALSARAEGREPETGGLLESLKAAAMKG
jgi:integrase